MAVGPQIRTSERLRVGQMGLEGQQPRRAFLYEADPGVPVAVHAAFVPFRLSKPALQVEVILGEVRLFAPNKQPRLTAGHDTAQMLPGRIIARVERLL